MAIWDDLLFERSTGDGDDGLDVWKKGVRVGIVASAAIWASPHCEVIPGVVDGESWTPHPPFDRDTMSPLELANCTVRSTGFSVLPPEMQPSG